MFADSQFAWCLALETPVTVVYTVLKTVSDYDAPLSEAGDITPKYTALRKVLKQHAPKHSCEYIMSIISFYIFILKTGGANE